MLHSSEKFLRNNAERIKGRVDHEWGAEDNEEKGEDLPAEKLTHQEFVFFVPLNGIFVQHAVDKIQNGFYLIVGKRPDQFDQPFALLLQLASSSRLVLFPYRWKKTADLP